MLTVTVGQFCVWVGGRGHLLHISSTTMRVKGSLDLFIFMIHCYGKPSTVLLLLLWLFFCKAGVADRAEGVGPAKYLVSTEHLTVSTPRSTFWQENIMYTMVLYINILISYFLPPLVFQVTGVTGVLTRSNWARKVREFSMFNVLSTVYCGRGCVSLESERGKELA